MGKTPKKAAPGGDERNLYVRRLKATNMPSKTSETILPERQRESEMSNRPKLSGIHKKIAPASGKNFKSKLRSPTKLGLTHQSKRLTKPAGQTSGQEKKLLVDKRILPTSSNMQSETEDAEVKHNTTTQKDDSKKEDFRKEDFKKEDSKKEDSKKEDSKKEDSKKDVIDKTDNENEQIVFNKEETVCIDGEQQSTCSNTKSTENVEEDKLHEKEIEVDEKEKESADVTLQENVENEEQEENLKLSFESEENASKSQEDNRNERIAEDIDDNIKQEEVQAVQNETKAVTNEKVESHCESPTDTESCSVDIVESTTSEVSETTEFGSPNSARKEKKKTEQTTNNDTSFVSYDASIMLKEVQVKLNDCLKDNSKLFETSNTDQSSPVPRDMSFGKTLRNISGRRSLGRMRHVTIRERRFSPNNSLYVNTSTVSIPQDETTDCKVLRYGTSLIDTLPPTNGSPVERKRKLEPELWDSMKKSKTETEDSPLSTPASLFKGLRRPITVSTPNTDSYKCQEKLNISDISNKDEILTEDSSTRKWCVLM